MSANNVEEAFGRLDKERLIELTYLAGGGRTFRGDRHSFLTFLNILRKEGESGFCDVVLEVEGEWFPAHRCVLAANSQFFYTLFTSGMRDSKAEHIKLCSLTSSALSVILDFFYTREIIINRDNAEDLLEAASFLLLNHVKNACASIISANLNISNCFSTKRVADRFALDDLKKKADTYMKEHFQRAKQEKEFYDLEGRELRELVSSDSIRVEKEEEVFEAVLKWVKHDPASRAKELPSLLPCLRYGSLSIGFVEEQFSKEPLLEENVFCQNFIKQQRRRSRSSRTKKHAVAKERPSAKVHNVVVGVGRGNLRTSFCYDIEDNIIYKLPAPPSPFFQLGVALLGKELYTVSRDRHDWDDNVSMVMKYTLGESQKSLVYPCWVEKNGSIVRPSVCHDKALVLALKGKLFILGGCSGSVEKVTNVQCFDPVENTWKVMAQLLIPRCMIGAVATDNHLYAIGGKRSHDSLSESLVERYNPEGNYWTSVASMNTPRASPQVTAITNNIFAIGGLIGGIEVTCEVYNVPTDKWKNIASLPNRFNTPKISFSLDDEIYVVGGGETCKYLKKRNSWKKTVTFRALQSGFEDYHFVQLTLPKFCYDQHGRIPPYSLVSFDRNFYDCSSDEDEDEYESDYNEPWFLWGDDSSGSDDW